MRKCCAVYFAKIWVMHFDFAIFWRDRGHAVCFPNIRAVWCSKLTQNILIVRVLFDAWWLSNMFGGAAWWSNIPIVVHVSGEANAALSQSSLSQHCSFAPQGQQKLRSLKTLVTFLWTHCVTETWLEKWFSVVLWTGSTLHSWSVNLERPSLEMCFQIWRTKQMQSMLKIHKEPGQKPQDAKHLTRVHAQSAAQNSFDTLLLTTQWASPLLFSSGQEVCSSKFFPDTQGWRSSGIILMKHAVGILHNHHLARIACHFASQTGFSSVFLRKSVQAMFTKATCCNTNSVIIGVPRVLFFLVDFKTPL